MTDKERAILEKLAEVDFAGRDQLIEEKGTGIFSIEKKSEKGDRHLYRTKTMTENMPVPFSRATEGGAREQDALEGKGRLPLVAVK